MVGDSCADIAERLFPEFDQRVCLRECRSDCRSADHQLVRCPNCSNGCSAHGSAPSIPLLRPQHPHPPPRSAPAPAGRRATEPHTAVHGQPAASASSTTRYHRPHAGHRLGRRSCPRAGCRVCAGGALVAAITGRDVHHIPIAEWDHDTPRARPAPRSRGHDDRLLNAPGRCASTRMDS